MREKIKLIRDCPATVIPGGEQMTLEKGAEVDVMQALGGSFTVMNDRGYMLRIDGQNADALGKEAPQNPATVTAGISLEKLVWLQLQTCYDPEIPVDIANLGLIYKCEITPLEEGGNRVYIQMTLTAPGCGMGETLRKDVQGKIEKLPDVKECKVDLVWEPAWNQSMMTDAAKLKLGML